MTAFGAARLCAEQNFVRSAAVGCIKVPSGASQSEIPVTCSLRVVRDPPCSEDGEDHPLSEQPTYPSEPEPAVQLEFDARINFAMQQNDVPVIKSLVIDNPLDRPLEKLRVHVSGEPEFCDPWEARIAQIPPKSSHALRSVDLMLSPVYLDELTERVQGQVQSPGHTPIIIATLLPLVWPPAPA